MILLKDVALTISTIGRVTRVETTSHRDAKRGIISQKLFGDTIPISCPRLIRLCAFGKFLRGRDSDAISVLLRRTRARVIFQVCTIRPYAGRFLIQEAKAAIVKTIRCQSFHTRQISHCTKVRVLDVPLDRLTVSQPQPDHISAEHSDTVL